MTDTPSVLVTADPAPGPGARVSRTSGQVGGALVFVELWQAFGWFGADTWTAEQAAQRWPAITGVIYFLISVGHNVWNWWTTRERTTVPNAVTVQAVEPVGEGGVTEVGLLVAVVLVVLLVVLLA